MWVTVRRDATPEETQLTELCVHYKCWRSRKDSLHVLCAEGSEAFEPCRPRSEI
jgi:hypothetical protein